jgi:hypothetical protein
MRLLTLALALIWLGMPLPAAAQGDLERARLFYNSGNFDAAIEFATNARSRPATTSSAALIIARARLERFRQSANPEDLDRARAELTALTPQNLSPPEIVEWQIGVGQALYFENELGPAAEWFGTLIPSVRLQMPAADADKLLEWWAGTTSRLAESLSGEARADKYRELLAMMELELQRDPWSRAATYWISVASRGVGDLDRAWNTAIAGWVRARGLVRPAELRADFEQFVTQTVIPERAQMRTGQRLDTKPTMAEVASMTEAWRRMTGRWNGED